jgi:hypothetical protein
VAHQLADRDAASHFLVGVFRPVRGERRIEIESPRCPELENRNLGEGLVDGTEIESGLRVIGDAALAIRHAVCLLKNGLAILRQQHNSRELIDFGQAVDRVSYTPYQLCLRNWRLSSRRSATGWLLRHDGAAKE